jgi:flagellar biosynthetic protein FliR
MNALPLSEASVAAWLFVFARLAGWALFDPLTGRLPVLMRLMLAAVLAATLTPGVAVEALPPFTVHGVLALGLEAVWGAALALCVWLVFAAATAALSWSGHTATGGLLTLTADQAMPADAAWRALAGWLAALAFLGASGHLLVVDALRDSFAAMPAAMLPAAADLRQLAEAGGWLFATGVQLALPLLALALLVQLAFGIVARTTPGLDMFSVGLGIAALGLMVAWVWAVPLVAQGVGLGLSQLAGWLGRLAAE